MRKTKSTEVGFFPVMVRSAAHRRGKRNTQMADDSQKKNRIQVSNIMKPLFFYVNLAKRYIQQYDDVELSVLGMVISIMTSKVDIKYDLRGHHVPKAKIVFDHKT
ncbi:hypothetical protein F2Q68_00011311 [Brassica cretica]|uniref:Uncharacterized protein n=1 Tax=Brassica cretica TaxID=69181 RepID=A0A8S9KZA0_BRACR|nr:hypothetical protein F2Q68_00011311 [Brassica cretica]